MSTPPAHSVGMRAHTLLTAPFHVDLLKHVWWHRRLLSALAAAACVASVVTTLAPPAPPTTPVLVAARTLPSGTRLAESDLTVVAMPRDLVPESALGVGCDDCSPVGRTVAAPLSRGSVLTSTSVIGPGLASLSPGMVLTTVAVDDAGVAAMLQVGDRVDVLAQGATDPVATGVRVAALPSSPAGGSGPLAAGSGRGSVIVVELTRAQSARLAAVGRGAGLSVAMAPH